MSNSCLDCLDYGRWMIMHATRHTDCKETIANRIDRVPIIHTLNVLLHVPPHLTSLQPIMPQPTQLHSEIGRLQGIYSEKDRIDAQTVCNYVMFEANTCTSYRNSASTSGGSDGYPQMIQEASTRISARSEATLRSGALSGNASDRLELGKRCIALIYRDLKIS